MIQHISDNNTIFNTYLAEMRDVHIQQDPLRFRKNLERVGTIMAYEVSKVLHYQEISVQTPLGTADCNVMDQQPVLATILRAGLGMHMGFLDIFDRAENAFVSAYRKHSSLEEFEIHVEYMAAPSIEGKVLIISDPMLATGNSMQMVYQSLLANGTPSRTIICAAIAAPEALIYLQDHLPKDTLYYVGAIDKELTAQSYIVPGLGDAGDLAYGVKL
ncbi:MAG: uracil phosphoribosyltransferase [Crocinitomicaceae bacterium]